MRVLAIDLSASTGPAYVNCIDGAKLVIAEIHRFRNKRVRGACHLYSDVPRLKAKHGLPVADSQHADRSSVGIDTTKVVEATSRIFWVAKLIGEPREVSLRDVQEIVNLEGEKEAEKHRQRLLRNAL
ncbi:MAG: hypothetical protein M3Q03_21000 [Chloroflexota bacterium]|nr:hypothetical protein [Chloroflexota bacterium]